MFYLGTVEVDPVSANSHLSGSMVFIGEIWTAPSHIKKVGRFIKLIVVGEIL